MPYELVLCPFELKVPCKHLKFVTLRARSIVEAWIYLLIKGCTTKIEDLVNGRGRLDESKDLSPISVEGQRTQFGVRRVVAGQKE